MMIQIEMYLLRQATFNTTIFIMCRKKSSGALCFITIFKVGK